MSASYTQLMLLLNLLCPPAEICQQLTCFLALQKLCRKDPSVAL
jgi:hypothetical protein